MLSGPLVIGYQIVVKNLYSVLKSIGCIAWCDRVVGNCMRAVGLSKVDEDETLDQGIELTSSNNDEINNVEEIEDTDNSSVGSFISATTPSKRIGTSLDDTCIVNVDFATPKQPSVAEATI